MVEDKKRYRNTEGLVRSARENNEASIEGAKKAVRHFKRSNETKITAEKFAEKAKISVATIYNNPPIKEMFLQLKAIKSGKEVAPTLTPSEQKKQETKNRITRLMNRVEELEKDKADCIAQIAALTAEVISLKNRLMAKQAPVSNMDDYRNKN